MSFTIGAAPGVGKTFAMLTEANEKRKQGMDIVITKISDTCPLIYGDPVLLERVLAIVNEK